jgi:DNA-binding NtrC family response regulator
MKQLRDKSVLIIDDDAGMLRALDKVLTGEGATVTRASWAGDAVEILTGRQKNFDLVITDLRMPFVTGLTVVYAVHKIYPQLPVVVLTAFGSPDVKAECFRQGAAAFLEKPLNTAELMAAVEKVFSARRPAFAVAETESLPEDYSAGNRFEDMETNRLIAARRPPPGRQTGEPGSSADASAANRRKEQNYEHHWQQNHPHQ